MKKIALTLFVTLLTTNIHSVDFSFAKGGTMKEISNVSIINLVATPDIYHKKKIRLIGFVTVEFERTVVFLSRTDAEHSINKNGVWIDLEITDKHKEFHNHYCLVEGIFDMDSRGHGHMYSGSIREIKRIEIWK